MALDDEWARDYQRRLNESMFGFAPPPYNGMRADYTIYDEAFTFFDREQQGPYQGTFGRSWGPPSLARVYRCRCDHPESEHDDSGVCHRPGGFAGICDCGPRTPDPLWEMIDSWR